MPEILAQSAIPAIERAIELYEQHGLRLGEHLQDFLRHPHGVIIKRPDLLVLARPASLADPARWLGLEELDQADAWYVRLVVGSAAAALALMPFPLPWCCWHRNFRAGPAGPLHAARTDRLIAKLRRSEHGR